MTRTYARLGSPFDSLVKRSVLATNEIGQMVHREEKNSQTIKQILPSQKVALLVITANPMVNFQI